MSQSRSPTAFNQTHMSLSILSDITRDKNYAKGLTAPDGHLGRTWDSRFVVDQIPSYDATRDRFCKFRRKFPSKSSSDRKKGGKSPHESMLDNDVFQRPLSMLSALAGGGGVSTSPARPGGFNASIMGGASRRGSVAANKTLVPLDMSVDQLHAKSLNKIQVLWDELKVPPQVRKSFLDIISPKSGAITIDHVARLNDEIQDLLNVKNAQAAIEQSIEVREGFLYLLQEITERVASATVPLDMVKISKEFQQLIVSMRSSTLDCVENIMRWQSVRHPETAESQASTYRSYTWKGIPYLLKLQSDLNFLGASMLKSMVSFSLMDNGLLDPRVVKRKSGTGGDMTTPLDNNVLPAATLIRMDACRDAIAKEVAYSRTRRASAQGPKSFGRVDSMTMEEEEPSHTSVEGKRQSITSIGAIMHNSAEESAVINIQRVYRGFCGRQKAHRTRRQHHAAIKIQCLVRRSQAVTSVEYLRTRYNAATLIQARQRGILTRVVIGQHRKRTRAALKIQRQWRGYYGRKRANWRRFVIRCATDIQRVYRGYHIRKLITLWKSTTYNSKATKIEKAWKGFLVRRDPKYNKTKQQAIVTLQAWFRGQLDRSRCRKVARRKAMCIRVQKWWRMVLAIKLRNKLWVEKQDKEWQIRLSGAETSATKIQSTWKMHTVVVSKEKSKK
eukprot:PhF_6_TR32937/c0_g1_i1/m.48419